MGKIQVLPPRIKTWGKVLFLASYRKKSPNQVPCKRVCRSIVSHWNYEMLSRPKMDIFYLLFITILKKLIFFFNFYLFEQSKGGILEKTVQYLLDIKEENLRLMDHIKTLEKFKFDNDALRQQVNYFIFVKFI